MILPQLLRRFAQHRDDAEFYRLQAVDAVRWIQEQGLKLGPHTHALDLGCGHGVFGRELARMGCRVDFADEKNFLLPELGQASFQEINLDTEPVTKLGRYDLVVCSNVLEHLSKPERFLSEANAILNPNGLLFLSWTNWLSPWGGHEFSPWHYLGPRLGPKIYDHLSKRPRFHTPYVNLFPTFIGSILWGLRRQRTLQVVALAPRYYTEFSFLMRIPVAREFLAWNCAMLLRSKTG